MMRIGLFLLTNLAVIVVFSIVFGILSRMFGLGGVYGLGASNLLSLAIMCFIYGMVGSLISLFLSKWLAKKSTKTQVIAKATNPTEQWLLDTVAKQAKAVNIAMPEVGVFPSNAPNAFATGWNKNAALVAVSSGLLQTMTDKEVEAVLAHEIGHVANGDMVTLALLQGVVNAFVMFFARIIGTVVDQAVFKNNSNRPGAGYFITTLVMDMVLGVLATAIVMWFSRFREYRADEMGAKLTGREHMIGALQALSRNTSPQMMPEGMKAFAISSGKVAGLFRSHPPLEARIHALQNLPNQ